MGKNEGFLKKTYCFHGFLFSFSNGALPAAFQSCYFPAVCARKACPAISHCWSHYSHLLSCFVSSPKVDLDLLSRSLQRKLLLNSCTSTPRPHPLVYIKIPLRHNECHSERLLITTCLFWVSLFCFVSRCLIVSYAGQSLCLPCPDYCSVKCSLMAL